MKKFKQETNRILSMLQLAGVAEQTPETIQKALNLYGVERTIERFNEKYNTYLRIGAYVIKSDSQKGFWSNDFGWCSNKSGATGYSEEDLLHYTKDGVPKPAFIEKHLTDAEFVLYATAKDFPDEF